MINLRMRAVTCLVCVWTVGAIVADHASAVNGTTVYTCRAVVPSAGTAGFAREHCKPDDALPSNAAFEHVSVTQDTTTELTVTNDKTNINTNAAEPTTTHVALTGIEISIRAGSEHGTGTIINKLDPTNEHYVHAVGIVSRTEVTVVKPAGCAVTGGTITSKELTTTSTGQGMGIKFQPKEGTTLAEFNVEGATCPEAVKGSYKATGSYVATVDGATLVFDNVTEQGTLKLRNVKAGVEGKLTLSGRANSGEAYTPLSMTTVTP